MAYDGRFLPETIPTIMLGLEFRSMDSVLPPKLDWKRETHPQDQDQFAKIVWWHNWVFELFEQNTYLQGLAFGALAERSL